MAPTPSKACGSTFESAAGNAATSGSSPLVTNARSTIVRYGVHANAYHIQNRESRDVMPGSYTGERGPRPALPLFDQAPGSRTYSNSIDLYGASPPTDVQNSTV